jgi:hypothetical protein
MKWFENKNIVRDYPERIAYSYLSQKKIDIILK